MTVEDAETPELRPIAERARRRQKRLLLIVVLIGLLSGVLGATVASRFGHRNHAQHHGSALRATLVVVAIVVVEGGLFYWFIRRHKGIFETPLVMGLSWRDRRAVAKAVRRGRPPPDALLRLVGLRMAERLLRYRQLTRASYLILVLVQVVNALIPDRPSWFRFLCAATAIIFLWALFYHRAVIAGAHRYVERCASWPT